MKSKERQQIVQWETHGIEKVWGGSEEDRVIRWALVKDKIQDQGYLIKKDEEKNKFREKALSFL